MPLTKHSAEERMNGLRK